MAKKTWNKFTSKNENPIGYIAGVAAKLPGKNYFDLNKKKLPTPYGLFQEWASITLTGDWATTKVPSGFIICVISASDSSLIVNKFGKVGSSKETPACSNTTQISYQDSSYGLLAKSLGYKLKNV